jgi:hypothetical protein
MLFLERYMKMQTSQFEISVTIMIFKIDSVVDSVVGGGRTDTVLGTHMHG